ncbi:MAG: hypothetical protein NC489_44110 [Ruminococcus flavefaciens]|nr:hypothetical protein [Ruminococcus flavefaciens]
MDSSGTACSTPDRVSPVAPRVSPKFDFRATLEEVTHKSLPRAEWGNVEAARTKSHKSDLKRAFIDV